MTSIILIRVNCPTRDEAETLGATAVEARLAACANIEGPVTSIYHWEGQLARDEEYVLWLKTRADLWSEAEDFITRQHSFDTPAILALPCQDANQRYEAWLHSNTKARS